MTTHCQQKYFLTGIVTPACSGWNSKLAERYQCQCQTASLPQQPGEGTPAAPCRDQASSLSFISAQLATATRGVALPVVRNHRQPHYPSSPGNTDESRSPSLLPAGNSRPGCLNDVVSRGGCRELTPAVGSGCSPGQLQGTP